MFKSVSANSRTQVSINARIIVINGELNNVGVVRGHCNWDHHGAADARVVYIGERVGLNLNGECVVVRFGQNELAIAVECVQCVVVRCYVRITSDPAYGIRSRKKSLFFVF